MKYLVLASITAAATALVGNAALSASVKNKLSEAKLSQANVSFETTGSIKKVTRERKVPLLKYKNVVNEDGSIEVLLDEISGARGPQKQDVMTIFAPNVRTTEQLLHSQDWYLTVDPNGGMRGIYTVPRDAALPSSVLRNLGEGFGVLKVNPRNSFFKVFPSKYQLASQLTTFTEAARKSVCSQKAKPEKLSASVDVTPGWSAAGNIKFNATWNVSDLCKKTVKK